MLKKRIIPYIKKWAVHSSYAQVFVVFIAFAVMVVSSYLFVRNIELEHLRENIQDAISYTEANIKSDLLEPETILGTVSETIRDLILRGENVERIKEYISYINDYVQSDKNERMADVIGFYGVFDAYGGRFLAGSDIWEPPEDYDPSSRPWYSAAVKASGDVGVTEPYIDLYSNEVSITFSRRIFSNDDVPLGIVGLDIKLDRIRQYAINTRFAENGYGFLLSENMELIAHPEPSMLGIHLHDIKSGIADYEDELKQKGYISEVIAVDYRSIESIISIKKIQNGWYMGIVTPRDNYYQGTRGLARMLIALGLSLAVILSVILIQIISKKQKADEHTRNLAHWYKNILDTIPLPISVTDSDMNWTFINKAVENFLEVNRDDVMGLPCSTWKADICNTENCGILRLKQGLAQTHFRQKGLSFQVDSGFLTDLNDKISGYVEVVQDISKLEQATKLQFEAESANVAKSSFLARVSHEIRTPMNAILGITEIQMQNENLPRNVLEALEKIYNSGYLLLGIINDILDLSKIEAGKLELSPVNYDVASLINDTLHINTIWSESKSIVLNLQLDDNIPSTLFGDDLRIKQILNNLLSNAFKYTESGEVNFSIAVEPAQSENAEMITLVFNVKDTGQGMTDEQVDKLFDEYTRFNTEANRTTIGMGLGMAITKNLIQIMNGDISVKSEAGKGSLFTVRLPQMKINNEVLSKEMTESLQNFSESKISHIKKAPQIVREYMPYGRVLLVDDVETNLYVGMGLLAPYGLLIETALSGYETINKIKNGAVYDIIFMDHYMPRMDGIEATHIIRDLGYIKPVIALTANALAGQAEIFLENGFDGFISKPIDIRQLNTVLNKYIRDRYPKDIVEAARSSHNNRQKENPAENPAQALFKIELAGFFTRDAEKTIAVLETIHKNNYRRNTDIQAYIINVHSMKSALANIEEEEVSKHAARLEKAGRGGDTALMSQETPVFIDELKAIIGKIKPKDNNKNVEDDTNYLREKLILMQAACEIYDKKTAKNALSEIKQKTWSSSIKDALEDISEDLLHSNFDKASETAKALIRSYP